MIIAIFTKRENVYFNSITHDAWWMAQKMHFQMKNSLEIEHESVQWKKKKTHFTLKTRIRRNSNMDEREKNVNTSSRHNYVNCAIKVKRSEICQCICLAYAIDTTHWFANLISFVQRSSVTGFFWNEFIIIEWTCVVCFSDIEWCTHIKSTRMQLTDANRTITQCRAINR